MAKSRRFCSTEAMQRSCCEAVVSCLDLGTLPYPCRYGYISVILSGSTRTSLFFAIFLANSGGGLPSDDPTAPLALAPLATAPRLTMADSTPSDGNSNTASTSQSSADPSNQSTPTTSDSSPPIPPSEGSSDPSTSLVQSPAAASLPTRNGPKGARHLQPKPAVKSGRKSSWPPKKRAWLEGHIPHFLACTTDAQASKFYDRITYLWFKIFDWGLPIRQDPDGDIDEDAALARPEEIGNLTEEEMKERGRLVQSLRMVSHFLVLHV